MATISKMSAIVTASIAGFSAAMHQAGEHAEGFGERFRHVAEGVAEVAAIMGVSLSLEGAVEYLKRTFETIEATDRLAISLGTTTQALGHLDYAAKIAGVSQETLHGGLTKMLKAIDAARDGDKGASEALDKLGLSAKDFVGLSADEAFQKVAASINNAKDRAAALHAAVSIFGRNAGAELLPLLSLSTEQFEEMAGAADRTGYALDGIESAKVAQAGEEMRKFEAAIQGAANQLIVAMSPYLTAVAQKLNEVSSSGDGMGKTVINAFEWVVTGIAKAADYLELLEAGWDTLKSGALYAIAGIEWGLEQVVESVIKVLDYFHISHDALTEYAESVKQTHEDMMNSAAEAWDNANKHVDNYANGANSEAVKKFFDDIKQKANETAKATEESHKKLEGMGRIAEGEDKPDEKALKKLQDEAKKLYEETRTPLEKFEEQVDKINELFADGQIDVDTYSRALNKAEEDLDKATKKKEKFHHLDVEAPKLLEAGSEAASEFVAKFQAQQKENEKEKELLAEARRQREATERMAKNIEDAAFFRVIGWE